MDFIKLLLVAVLSSLITGQIVRIPLPNNYGSVTLTDLFVLAACVVFIIYALSFKKSLKLPRIIVFPILLFTLSALASTVFALDFFSVAEIAISALFLLRFVSYFFLTIIIYNIVNKKEIISWLNLMLTLGLIFLFVGIVQFIIVPDFSFLTRFGWDPHQERLASTVLDPNFAGGILTILSAFSISLFLFRKKNVYLAMFLLSFLALILTFSRSSYLAFLVTIGTVGVMKSPRIFFLSVTFLVFAFATSNQVKSRIIGALTLDETAQARIESWNNALTVFKDNPFFGVGFNTYRFAQANYGFFSSDQPSGGHSGAGTDSSILLVAATTGIIGLSFYLMFLILIIRFLAKRVKTSYLHLASFASFSGLLIHSQFVNSLFFPQIMVLMWFALGLSLQSDS